MTLSEPACGGRLTEGLIGKRTNKWNQVRAKLKIEFERKGITRCELCQGTFGLAFAHSKKRRFIQTDEDWYHVALLCQPCHQQIEFSGHDEMFEAINQIINNR